MKVARTVRVRGKGRDNLKALPINIIDITDSAVVCCAYLVTGAYLRELKLGKTLKPISQNKIGNDKWYGCESRKKWWDDRMVK